MSYEKGLRLKYEDISSDFLVKTDTSDDTLRQSEIEMQIYCMKEHNSEFDYKHIRDITWKVKCYVQLLVSKFRYDICEEVRKNGEIYFHGWEYSRESDFDIDKIINDTIRGLSLLALCVKTPDYFDEQEKFYEKYNVVKDECNLIDIIYDIVSHDFIEKHDKFVISYDDDDEEILQSVSSNAERQDVDNDSDSTNISGMDIGL